MLTNSKLAAAMFPCKGPVYRKQLGVLLLLFSIFINFVQLIPFSELVDFGSDQDELDQKQGGEGQLFF